MSQPLLHLDRATIRFGGLTAVSDLSLEVHPNELIGPSDIWYELL
jgi:ABC-type branched-subunit amino acid transport system ATPase component